MAWINLQEQLPPSHTKVLVTIDGNYYIGVLGDTTNTLQLVGYVPTGIVTSAVYWMPIPSIK